MAFTAGAQYISTQIQTSGRCRTGGVQCAEGGAGPTVGAGGGVILDTVDSTTSTCCVDFSFTCKRNQNGRGFTSKLTLMGTADYR